MEKRKNLTVVFYYKSTSTYALNVLLGALELAPLINHAEIICVSKSGDIIPVLKRSLEQGRKILALWSFYSPEFSKISSDLSIIKKNVMHSDVVHLAGGVHSTAEPEETLAAGFDYVAMGEGEKIITNFASAFLNGEDPSHVKGISSLDGEGRMISNGYGERIDLNEFPPFAEKHRKFNPIEITRGCIYACKFCQTPFMFKARFRHRSIENVCHYVQVMKDHGLNDIRFITPTALSYGSSDESVNIDKIEELLSSVRRTLGNKGRIFFGTFPSEVRPEHVSPKVLRILKSYVANDNIIIGGQAGSQTLLDTSKRGHSVQSIIDAVKLSVEFGFIPNVDFIFGLPGETAADVKQSLNLAEKLIDMGARIHGHTFMPLPGTPFKDAPPGKIGTATLRRLKRLESRGKLYGNWNQQRSIALSLAETRRSRRSHT